MDEIMFHLSNQFETLQVQSSVLLQHCQQWLYLFLDNSQRIIQEIYNEQHIQLLKNLSQKLLYSLKNAWERLLFQYQSINLNPHDLYYQVEHLFRTSKLDVSRREIMFCLVGISIGILIGYSMGLNWDLSSRHMHHMKAVVCHCYIGIEGVSMIDDAEMPRIQQANELLIQVRAASVNVIDTKICNGYSQFYRKLLNSGKHKHLPLILGRDCSGVVVDIGRNVINFDIGDEVFLAVPSWAPGTMAEYIVCSETQVVKTPKHVPFEASASIPYCGCLAWDALVNKSVIKEGNAKGKRVLVYGGATPVGCILIQLIKLWGGEVTAACRSHAIPVTRALGADEIISLTDTDLEKELELYEKFNAIFYTGDQLIDEQILKKNLLPNGSYVSTVPEYLASDSLGFVLGSIFAGCVRIKLLVQYMFGFNIYQWKEGSKIKSAYLQSLSDLVASNHLQVVVDKAYAPHHIEQALNHVIDPNAIGSTIIKF